MANIRKNSRWPKNISMWIISLGFILYVLVDLLHSNLLDFDPYNASPRMVFIEWFIRIVRDTALTVAVATMIISGIRDIRKSGYTLKRFLVPALGIFISISFLIMSGFGYQTFKKLEPHRTSDVMRNQIKSRIDSPDILIDKKSQISKFYASILFHEDGNQSNYITESGKVELYKPTDKEIKQREEILKYQVLNKWMAKSLYLSIYFWLAVISISLLLGFIIPIPLEHKASPNQVIQADAAEPRH